MDAYPADPCPWCGFSLKDHTSTDQKRDDKTAELRIKCHVTARTDSLRPVHYVQGVTG